VATTRKRAGDRSEIRFEGQRRIGNFRAIRSASLLRKSIGDGHQQASMAAGLGSAIQVVCQCSNSSKVIYNQSIAYFASQQFNRRKCRFGEHELKLCASNHPD
jgi:hypothetical protein